MSELNKSDLKYEISLEDLDFQEDNEGDLKLSKVRKEIKNLVARKIELSKVKESLIQKGYTDLLLNQFDEIYISKKYVKYCFNELIVVLEKRFKQIINEGKVQDIIHNFNDLVDREINESDHGQLLEKVNPIIYLDYDFEFRQRLLIIVLGILSVHDDKFKNEYKIQSLLLQLKTFLTSFPVQILLDQIIDEFELRKFLASEVSIDYVISRFKKYRRSFDYISKINKVYPYDYIFKRDINEEFDTNLNKVNQICETINLDQKNEIDNNYELIQYLRTIVQPYVIETKERNSVLEIKTACLVISKLNTCLIDPKKLHSDVKEIRIFANDYIYIDADLNLPSINVLLYAREVIVKSRSEVKINLSGGEGINAPQNRATDGSSPGKDGQDGEDGGSGKSGGNITIVAERIRYNSKLVIISNGGKGGDGQSGGNGVKGNKGKDGKEYSLRELKELFPNPCKVWAGLNVDNYNTMSHSCYRLFPGKVIDRLDFPRKKIYLSAVNNDGNRLDITYLLTWAVFGNIGEVLVLMKGAEGSLGQLGGRGGLGGRNGSGGLEGNIEFRHPIKQKKPDVYNSENCEIKAEKGVNGINGDKGRDEPRGEPGKNGRDSGYCDHNLWINADEYDLQFLKIISSNEKAIECWSRGYSIKIDRDNYTERQIREYSADIQSKTDNRANLSKAQKNRSITEDVINSYQLKEIDRPVENKLYSDAMHKMCEIEIFKEKKLEQVHITTTKSFVKNINFKPKHNASPCVEQNEDFMGKIDGVSNQNLLNYLEQKLEDFNYSDCIKIFQEFGLNSSDSQNEKFWKTILIVKNRFAILRMIAQKIDKFPNDYKLHYNDKKQLMIPIPVAEDYDSGFHCILGVKNEVFDYYECSHSDNVRKTFSDNLLERFRIRDKTYIFERLNKHLPTISKPNDEDKKLINIFAQSLKALFQNKFIININDNYTNSFTRLKLEFKKYSEFENKENFDWNKIAEDKSLQKEYSEVVKLYNYRLSISDLQLMAVTKNLNLFIYQLIYYEDLKQPVHKLISETSCLKPEEDIYISYEEIEDLETKDKKIRLYRIDFEECNDLSLTYERLGEIIDNCNEINNSEDIDFFLKSGDLNETDIHDTDVISENNSLEELLEELTDDNMINEIKDFFNDKDRNEIILSHLKYEYTNSDLIEIIWKRFKAEGLGINAREMKILIQKITEKLKESDDQILDEENLVEFRWILSAYPQKKWITELVLCKLQERYSQELIVKWRKCLNQIKSRELIELLLFKVEEELPKDEELDKFFELLSYYDNMSTYQNVLFEDLSLSDCIIKLREIRLEKLLDNVSIKWKNEKTDKETMLYYIFALNNEYENTLVKLLHELSKCGPIPYEEMEKQMIGLLNGSSIAIENEQANNSNNEMNFTAYPEVFLKYCKTFEGERNLRQLIEIIKKDDNTTINKSLIEKIATSIVCINDSAKEISKNFQNLNKWISTFKNSTKDRKFELIPELLAYIDQAIYEIRIYNLRDTQKLAILLTILNERNLLSQVSTGEGKSLIVVSLAIIKTLLGHKVDVITSSPVLAKRDAQDNAEIFEKFGIKVGHNTSEKIEERQQQYREKDVIFGDCSCFQRDFLLDTFYNKQIRFDRKFDFVIVDEVDSMLLDKGNCVLYLSHQPPGLDSLETVFINIWQFIILSNDECCDNSKIRHHILSNIYPMITTEDLSTFIDENLCEKVFDFLIIEKIVDKNGKMLNSRAIVLPQELQSNYMSEKSLNYFINKRWNEENNIKVPRNLFPFIEKHLNQWIESAFSALMLEEGSDYTVDVDRYSSRLDRNPNIVIIDKDTGVDQFNSQWSEGLHQFLQIKHNCKLSLVNLKAVFISNIKYFKNYKSISGLTGTLGSIIERKFLEETYSVDFVNIPLALNKRFKEFPPIICQNKNEWEQKIFENCSEIIQNKKQSILIICETVNDVEQLYRYFYKKGFKENVYQYKRSYETFEITSGDEPLKPGFVIIATNLAGRGTDIKISLVLNKNGGLHVIIGYLPDNIRVEQQAFGRSARKGNNGSGQLIFVKPNAESKASLMYLKRERDDKELLKISEIKNYYNNFIKFEEELFKIFSESYEKLELRMNYKFVDDSNDNKKIKEIVLSSCLDLWAFWLDRIGDKLKNIHQVDCDLYEEIKKLNEKLDYITDSNSALSSVTEPLHVVSIGKYLAQNKARINEAIDKFDSVISSEPQFCESAHYYKAMALMNKTENMKTCVRKTFIDCLNSSEKLINERIRNIYAFISIVKKLKSDSSLREKRLVTIDAYKIQKETLIEIYNFFLQSIHDILGHEISSDSLVCNEFEKQDSNELYEYLINKKVLTQKCMNESISGDKIKEFAQNYGLDSKLLIYRLQPNRVMDEFTINLLEKELNLPNREELWNILVDNRVLINEITFSVLTRDLSSDEFSLYTTDIQIKEKLKIKKINNIYLYNFNEQNVKEYIITRERAEELKKINKFEKIYDNSRAELDIEKLKQFLKTNFKFGSLKENDFETINTITNHESKLIYTKLIEQNFTTREGFLKETNFSMLNLKEFSVYSDEVLTIINVKCVYKIALLRLEEMQGKLCQETIDPSITEIDKLLELGVKSKPINDFIFDLMDNKIVKPVQFNHDIKSENDCKKYMKPNYYESKPILNKLSDDKTIEKIVKILFQLKGKLYTTETPKAELNDLIELYESMDENSLDKIEELNLFSINGFDHKIVIGEKKYSSKMIFNCIACVLLGLTQIAIGIAIEWASVGLMTHVGSGLINEGIGDIIYTMQCARTGFFNWSDYKQHKLWSVGLTVITGGFAAYFSRGAKVSKFGYKLVGNTGSDLSKTSGFALNQALKGTVKELNVSMTRMVLRRFAIKAGQAFANGMTNIAVTEMTDKVFRNFCDKVSAEILIDVEKSMNESKFNEVLREVYEKLGKYRMNGLINEFTNKIQEENSNVSNVSRCFGILKDGFVSGLGNALGKRSKYNGRSDGLAMLLSIADIQNVLQVFSYSKTLLDMKIYQQEFINNLLEELKIKSNTLSSNQNLSKNLNREELNKFNNEFNEFKTKIEKQWKQILRDRMSRDIQFKLIEPVISLGAQKLMSFLKKNFKKYTNARYEKRLRKLFDKKRKHLREVSDKSDSSETSKIECDQVRRKLFFDLQIICAKTKSPNLVADIILEGGPVSYIEIQALSNLTGANVEAVGVDGIKFPKIIEPKNGKKSGKTIRIDISYGKISKSIGHISPKDNQSNVLIISDSFDCLFQSVDRNLIPRDCLTTQDFRKHLANIVRTDKSIHNIIKEREHKFYIAKEGLFGYSKPIEDFRNEFFITEAEHEKFKLLVGLGGCYGAVTFVSKDKLINAEHFPPFIVYEDFSKEHLKYIPKALMPSISVEEEFHSILVSNKARKLTLRSIVGGREAEEGLSVIEFYLRDFIVKHAAAEVFKTPDKIIEGIENNESLSKFIEKIKKFENYKDLKKLHDPINQNESKTWVDGFIDIAKDIKSNMFNEGVKKCLYLHQNDRILTKKDEEYLIEKYKSPDNSDTQLSIDFIEKSISLSKFVKKIKKFENYKDLKKLHDRINQNERETGVDEFIDIAKDIKSNKFNEGLKKCLFLQQNLGILTEKNEKYLIEKYKLQDNSDTQSSIEFIKNRISEISEARMLNEEKCITKKEDWHEKRLEERKKKVRKLRKLTKEE